MALTYDAHMELKVLATDGVAVKAEVVEGGTLGEHKGINLPGVALRTSAMRWFAVTRKYDDSAIVSHITMNA